MDSSGAQGGEGPGGWGEPGAGGARTGTRSKAGGGEGDGQPARAISHPPVLLFDGDCGLCTRSVQFVFRRDPEGVFRFAPLGSPVGVELVEQGKLDGKGDTVILLLDGEVLVRSEAVRAILLRLPGWRWAGLLLGLIPRAVRDPGYRLVARVRRWVVPPPRACPLPDPRIRARLLDR